MSLQSYCAQCDFDANEHLMLDSIVDNRKTDKAFSLEDQKIVIRVKSAIGKSTAGSDNFCEWKECSDSLKKLPNLKEMHPVQKTLNMKLSLISLGQKHCGWHVK